MGQTAGQMARQERRDRVKALAEKGFINRQIAERMEIAIHTVESDVRTLRARGTPPQRPKKLGSTRKQVLNLVARGHSQTEISQKLGVGHSAVSMHVKRLMEYGFMPPIARESGTRKRVRHLSAQGLSFAAIAREIGISPQAVRQHAIKLKRQAQSASTN